MKLEEYQTTEENFTPDNYEEVKDDIHYHHSLKKCDCEIRVSRTPDERCSVFYTKYCKTHDVICSKTGWELGWYQGTKSERLGNVDTWIPCNKCGHKFMLKTELQLGMCPKCFSKTSTDEEWRALSDYRQERKLKQNKDSYHRTHNGMTQEEINKKISDSWKVKKERLNNLL